MDSWPYALIVGAKSLAGFDINFLIRVPTDDFRQVFGHQIIKFGS